jgi:hypothetical protein
LAATSARSAAPQGRRLLLKDAGCSSNAGKVAELSGADDAEVKRDRRTTDHLQPAQSLGLLWRSTSPGRPLRDSAEPC